MEGDVVVQLCCVEGDVVVEFHSLQGDVLVECLNLQGDIRVEFHRMPADIPVEGQSMLGGEFISFNDNFLIGHMLVLSHLGDQCIYFVRQLFPVDFNVRQGLLFHLFEDLHRHILVHIVDLKSLLFVLVVKRQGILL